MREREWKRGESEMPRGGRSDGARQESCRERTELATEAEVPGVCRERERGRVELSEK